MDFPQSSTAIYHDYENNCDNAISVIKSDLHQSVDGKWQRSIIWNIIVNLNNNIKIRLSLCYQLTLSCQIILVRFKGADFCRTDVDNFIDLLPPFISMNIFTSCVIFRISQLRERFSNYYLSNKSSPTIILFWKIFQALCLFIFEKNYW